MAYSNVGSVTIFPSTETIGGGSITQLVGLQVIDDGVYFYANAGIDCLTKHVMSTAGDITTITPASYVVSGDLQYANTAYDGIMVNSGSEFLLLTSGYSLGYGLSTPYDLSTVAYNSNDATFSGLSGLTTSIQLSPDETKLFVFTSDWRDVTVVVYTLSTPGDLTTQGVGTEYALFTETVDTLYPVGKFSSDGLSCYIFDGYSGVVKKIILSASLDFSQSFTVETLFTVDGHPGDVVGVAGGFDIGNDGADLFFSFQDEAGDYILTQYSLPPETIPTEIIAITVPIATFGAYTGSVLSISAPVATFSATATPWRSADIGITVPIAKFYADGTADYVASISATVPMVLFGGVATVVPSMDIAITSPIAKFSISATSRGDGDDSIYITVPMVRFGMDVGGEVSSDILRYVRGTIH